MLGGPTRANEPDPHRAGLYDPSGNRWTVTSKAPIGPFANQAVAVWTGRRVVVAGIARRGKHRLTVAEYDPSSNAWTRVDPPVSSRHPPQAVAMVATTDGVLLWSLWSRTQRLSPNTSTGYSGVDVYRLRRRSKVWRNVTRRWPRRQTANQPEFTGAKIVLAPSGFWCGLCIPVRPNTDCMQLSSSTRRQPSACTRSLHGPLDDDTPAIRLDSARAIASLDFTTEISGSDGMRPGDIAFWSPPTGRWTRGPNAPKPLGDMPAVWAKTRLLVLSQGGTLLSYGR